MTEPVFLFIETPRAGAHNHRFIVPAGYTGGDAALSQWADRARKREQGADFLVAHCAVKQQNGRTGVEQLILANVDVKRLSDDQIPVIQAFLQERLPTVERLVTQDIRWEEETQHIVPHSELTQWLQELQQRVGTLPAVPVKSKRRWFMDPTSWITGAILVFVIAAGCHHLDYCKGKPNEGVAATSPAQQTPSSATTAQATQTNPVNKPPGRCGNPAVAKKRMDLIVDAMSEKQKAKKEIYTRFQDSTGNPVSDAWKNSPLCNAIPEEGPWPLSVVFTEFTDRGAALASGLWGKAPDKWQIDNSPKKGSLQPLLSCRNAIRSLFGKDAQYTPFFQAEDFGGSNNPLGSLVDKVQYHKAVMKTREGCDSKPKVLVTWIGECFDSIDKVKKELIDENLKHIKAVEKACGAVFPES
jgi:hypothetical protein